MPIVAEAHSLGTAKSQCNNIWVGMSDIWEATASLPDVFLPTQLPSLLADPTVLSVQRRCRIGKLGALGACCCSLDQLPSGDDSLRLLSAPGLPCAEGGWLSPDLSADTGIGPIIPLCSPSWKHGTLSLSPWQLKRSPVVKFLIAFGLLVCVAASGTSPLFAKELPARPATVLLITSKALAESWKPFADWKTRLGKATTIVTVQQIAQQYPGEDIQAKIRNCVQSYLANKQTRWVILGGDSQANGRGHVPDRDTPHPQQGHNDIPTDLYYLSSGTWDADGDGIYGEWADDLEAIDYGSPDVALGRIPVRTLADVKAYTDKIIGYESRYPTQNFARQMVYTCPMRMAYPKLNTSKKTLGEVWPQGSLEQFFAHKTPWDGSDSGDYELSPENWVRLINQKRAAKLHVHGHGFLPAWMLESGPVHRRHIQQLTNQDAYLVMTTVSCFTGQYDAAEDPSITEAILRKPRGGAVLVIAPSREGVPIFHNRADFRRMVTEGKMDGTTETLTRFWKHALSKNMTAGEAFASVKKDMEPHARKSAGYHWCQCELNLLGDPTLDLRRNDPVNLSLTVPQVISTGPQKFTVTVGSTSTPATVCLWKGDELYQIAKTSQDGTAVFSVEPKTPGKLLVTAIAPSANAALQTIQVQK